MTITVPTTKLKPEIPSKADNHSLSRQLASREADKIITSLNVLLETTFDHEQNHALHAEGEVLVEGLVKAFQFCLLEDESIQSFNIYNPEKNSKRRRINNDFKKEQDDLDKLIENSWLRTHISYSKEYSSWSDLCILKLEKNLTLSENHVKIIEALILVIRNLSFVAANIRYLVYSEDILRLLGVCLYFRSKSTSKVSALISSSSDTSCVANKPKNTSSDNTPSHVEIQNSYDLICLYAINTLVNLAPYLDLTGKKLFSDKMLVQQPSSQNNALLPQKGFGQVHMMGMGGVYLAKKFDVADEKLPESIQTAILEDCKDYIISLISIFSGLLTVFDSWHNQSLIVSVLDLFKELFENKDIHPALLHAPPKLLTHLVHFLWVPRLGPDSLDYIDPLTNVVARVTALKLTNSYDATIDFDVRDRSLELLERFHLLSPEMMKVIVKNHTPLVYDYLLPICSSKVGRADITQIAINVLANLLQVDEDPVGIMYVERQLVMLAASDPYVANVVFNSILS